MMAYVFPREAVGKVDGIEMIMYPPWVTMSSFDLVLEFVR